MFTFYIVSNYFILKSLSNELARYGIEYVRTIEMRKKTHLSY